MRKSSIVLAIGMCVTTAISVDAGKAKPSKSAYLRFRDKEHVVLEKTADMLDVQQSFTIELWFRVALDSDKQLYLGGDEAWKGMHKQVQVEVEQGWVLRLTEIEGTDKRRVDFTIGVHKPRAGWFSVVTSPIRFDDPAVWHHVAVCRTSRALNIFVDGRLEASRRCATLAFQPSASDIYLGPRENGFPNRIFFGDIGAFRVSSEIRYHKTFAPSQTFEKDAETLLLSDFAMNKATLRDRTDRGRHGKIAGPVWKEEVKKIAKAKEPSAPELREQVQELRARLALIEQVLLEERKMRAGKGLNQIQD